MEYMTVLIPVIGASIVITLMILGILHLSGAVETELLGRLCLLIPAGVVTFILAVALVSSTI